MTITSTVQSIVRNYEGETPGVKAQLVRMLMQGRLGGTGRMVILPVDQGFEHGPARSFGINPAAYDPHYHYQLALDAGLSAYAAPLGPLEAGADTFAGQIPLILKVNSANTLYRSKEAPTQAITASVDDAIRLGCSAIGFTIYPGSDEAFHMMEDIREMGGVAFRDLSARRLPRFVFGYACTYAVNLGAFQLVHRRVADPVLCQVVLVVPMALFSYLVMSRFVFRKPRPGSAA